MDPQVSELLKGVEGEFQPYSYFCEDSDALTVYFRGDPDYSKRLTDHITLYLSLEDDSIVGCRVKGISGILEDLPNFLQVNHAPYELSLVFLPFIGEATPDVRQSIGGLAKSAREHRLTLDHPAKESCST